MENGKISIKLFSTNEMLQFDKKSRDANVLFYINLQQDSNNSKHKKHNCILCILMLVYSRVNSAESGSSKL